ncbi:MAG: DNA repair protein RecO [Bacteroidota bacterium]|nr:DNA repair protein RecO [Bacteroidota bacterium]
MIVKTEAIVLKASKYRETSKLVTFYTKRYGKINGIIKGARQFKNKFGSSLEPLSYVMIVFYKKESTQLHLVTQCDLLKAFKSISQDLDKLETALKIIELVYKVMHDEEENEKLFSLLNNILLAIETNNRNFANLFYLFEIKLGEILGYQYNFSICGKCGVDIYNNGDEMLQIVFDYSKGSLMCVDCVKYSVHPHKLSVRILKILNRIEKTEQVDSVTNMIISKQDGNEIGKFLFDYLRYHISSLKELKSEKVFSQLF